MGEAGKRYVVPPPPQPARSAHVSALVVVVQNTSQEPSKLPLETVELMLTRRLSHVMVLTSEGFKGMRMSVIVVPTAVVDVPQGLSAERLCMCR